MSRCGRGAFGLCLLFGVALGGLPVSAQGEERGAHTFQGLKRRVETPRILAQARDRDSRLRAIDRTWEMTAADAIRILTEDVRGIEERWGDPVVFAEWARALAYRAHHPDAREPLRRALRRLDPSAEPVPGGGLEHVGRSVIVRALAAIGDTAVLGAAMLETERSPSAPAFPYERLWQAGYLPPRHRGAQPLATELQWVRLGLDDLRLVPTMRASVDWQYGHAASIRAADALVALGDDDVVSSTRAWLLSDSIPHRIAAVRARVTLGSPDAFDTWTALLREPRPTLSHAAVAMAPWVNQAKVPALVMQHAWKDELPEAGRARVVYALAHHPSREASDTLIRLLDLPAVAQVLPYILARSPSPFASAVLYRLVDRKDTASDAFRALMVRAYLRNERGPLLARAAASMAASDVPWVAALGRAYAFVSGERALTDIRLESERVNKLTALSLVSPLLTPRERSELSPHLLSDTDPLVRAAGIIILAAPGTSHDLSERALFEHAEGPNLERLAAIRLLARTVTGDAFRRLAALVSTAGPLALTQFVIGLGESRAPEGTGFLAARYPQEAAPRLRYEIVRAMASRQMDRDSLAFQRTLKKASLEPNPAIRRVAEAGLQGRVPRAARGPADFAWVEFRVPDTAPGLGAQPPAILIAEDGSQAPIWVFGDGRVLALGVSAGTIDIERPAAVPTN